MLKATRAIGEYAAKRAAATGDACACNTQGLQFVATKSKCLVSKWSQAGTEAKQILNLYRTGNATYGDVKTHLTWLLAGALLFFAGEAVGRGSLVGYKESRD